MKSYLVTTGIVFGLIVLAHLWRLTAEGLPLARNPVFILTTLAAVGMCFWAGRLLRRALR